MLAALLISVSEFHVNFQRVCDNRFRQISAFL